MTSGFQGSLRLTEEQSKPPRWFSRSSDWAVRVTPPCSSATITALTPAASVLGSVPRHVDAHRPGGLRQHGLGPGPVAGIAGLFPGRVVFLIAEVLREFLIQRGLDDRLGQLFEQLVRTGQGQSLQE